MSTSEAIALCVRRCAQYRRALGAPQAEKACYDGLMRAGSSHLVACDVAAMARRIGELQRPLQVPAGKSAVAPSVLVGSGR